MRKVLFGLLALSGFLSKAFAQTAEEYKVTSLPGIDITTLNFTQYAGHIEIKSESNAHLFFWMIEREETSESEKLIIWLNGGPGCSSMDGLFLENGPFRVKKDLTLSVNPGGWQNYATNIYVDQPVGTGFSFAETDSFMHNMDEITEEFVTFIDKLFITFPHLKKQDLYIAGESFAGTYIPYFTARLLALNKEREEKYNVQGVAIGNGWISAEHQYNAYYDFSVAKKLVDNDRLPIMSEHLKICQEDLRTKKTIHINSCERILTDVIDGSTHDNLKGELTCLNMYDIRMKEEPSPECGLSWPYELSDVTEYLRKPEVKTAVHADKQILGWKECTSLVSIELHGDQSKPAYTLLPGILEEIPILLFSGEYDLICNSLGTEYLIGNMTWNGSRGFGKSVKKETWKIDDKLAGYYTQDRNLTYVLIKDGSHMVPYDRPIECLDMINRFIQVGNNEVKGKKSQVGNHIAPITPPPKDEENKVADDEEEEVVEKPPPTAENDTNFDDGTQGVAAEDKWSKYYSWGTTTLVFVILFAITLCCCWCRGTRPSATAEFGGAPQREREGIRKSGLLGFVQRLFKSSKPDHGRRKFRLDDNEESNELDELVIETPTLFEAEEGDLDPEEIASNQYNNTTSSHQFAIDESDTDEDFEDFAEFDDGEALASRKYKKKD